MQQVQKTGTGLLLTLSVLTLMTQGCGALAHKHHYTMTAAQKEKAIASIEGNSNIPPDQKASILAKIRAY